MQPLPAVAIERLDNAAQAAGCELRSPRNEGAAHESREFVAADYRSNPPTSGTHFPQWAADGVYEPGTTPPLGELVHALEHGRVQLQYAEDAAPETPARLRCSSTSSRAATTCCSSRTGPRCRTRSPRPPGIS